MCVSTVHRSTCRSTVVGIPNNNPASTRGKSVALFHLHTRRSLASSHVASILSCRRTGRPSALCCLLVFFSFEHSLRSRRRPRRPRGRAVPRKETRRSDGLTWSLLMRLFDEDISDVSLGRHLHSSSATRRRTKKKKPISNLLSHNCHQNSDPIADFGGLFTTSCGTNSFGRPHKHSL